ncbi:hypothetical protein [Kingella potus]|uniref:hypothetical protein n=1 Tax=Kingella potus TaxID=265175 RepID=UPI000E1B7996|nr:hypothetical protein [Kingella potus]UOP00299.1 hypothetical protein LVJ84_10370 [Kingella potus]
MPPKATHAFPTPQRIRLFLQQKPRAWLRHTPYPDRKGRLKKQHSSLVQNPIPTAPRRACRPKATHAFPIPQRIRLFLQQKPRAWLRHTPYLDRTGRLKKQHSRLDANPTPNRTA